MEVITIRVKWVGNSATDKKTGGGERAIVGEKC